jgi:hypothetical protein
MPLHFTLGAINKTTNGYEYPKIASKKNSYECPTCKTDVIFRKGQIKQPHFAHKKTGNSCCHYTGPSESQIHKDAKMLFKSLLENSNKILLNRKCMKRNICKNYEIIKINEIFDFKKHSVVLEHQFLHYGEKRVADIALIKDGAIEAIFEICYRNKTEEGARPEPWFEIDAEKIINVANAESNKCEILTIDCMRSLYECADCKNYEEKKKEWQKQKAEAEKKDKERREREEAEKRENDRREMEEANRLEKMRLELCNECNCGIKKADICKCESLKTTLINNSKYCLSCNKWKCRCAVI